jgi:hypothetical protein
MQLLASIRALDHLLQSPKLVAVSVATALGLSAPPVLLAQEAPAATASRLLAVVVGANPPATNNATNTLADYYDVPGRRYYLGIKLKF